MKKLVIGGAIVMAALAAAVVFIPSSDTDSDNGANVNGKEETETDLTVRMISTGFEPEKITIQKGETVAFVNETQVDRWPASAIHPTHQIYPEFDPKRAIAPGETWTFTFENAGIWRFHDHLFPATMKGIVTVEE